MADLNINPFDGRALAELAGRQAPQLNLKPIIYDDGSQAKAAAILETEKLKQKYAELANNIQVQQMQNTGEMQKAVYNGAVQQKLRDLDMRNQQAVQDRVDVRESAKLSQDTWYKKNLLENKDRDYELDKMYKMAGLDLSQQQFHQKQIMDAWNQKMQKSEFDLKREDQLNSSFIALLDKTKDPKQQEEIKNLYLSRGVSQGLLSQDQANQMSQMKPSELRIAAGLNSSLLSRVLTAKASAAQININPDGSETQNLGSATLNEVQKDQVNSLTSIRQLEDIGNKYADEYLTVGGRAKAFLGGLASSSGTGVVPGLQDFTQKREEFSGAVNRVKLQIIKELSGTAYSDKQLEDLVTAVISSQDNPAAFKGKFKGMLDFMRAGIEARNQLQKEGLPLDSKDFITRQNNILKKLNENNNVKSNADNNTSPSMSSQQAQSAQPIQMSQPSQSTPSEGEVWQDANGNIAKFTNGQWIEQPKGAQ